MAARVLLALTLVVCVAAGARAQTADLIVTNANIVTMDPSRPHAEAVGRVAFERKLPQPTSPQ